LNKHQIDDLKEKFKKYDPTKSGNGSIGKYEIFDTLRGFLINLIKYCRGGIYCKR